MENSKLSNQALSIAKWFLDKKHLNEDVFDKKKLNLLLYYSKGFYYVFENNTLFEDEFYIKENMVYTLQELPLTIQSDSTLDLNKSNLETKIKINILEFVYEKIAKIETEKLLKIIVEDIPKLPNATTKIKNEVLCDFFRNKYLSENKNSLNILRKDIVNLLSKNIFTKYEKAFKTLADK